MDPAPTWQLGGEDQFLQPSTPEDMGTTAAAAAPSMVQELAAWEAQHAHSTGLQPLPPPLAQHTAASALSGLRLPVHSAPLGRQLCQQWQPGSAANSQPAFQAGYEAGLAAAMEQLGWLLGSGVAAGGAQPVGGGGAAPPGSTAGVAWGGPSMADHLAAASPLLAVAEDQAPAGLGCVTQSTAVPFPEVPDPSATADAELQGMLALLCS